jgi:hypothetical protein
MNQLEIDALELALAAASNVVQLKLRVILQILCG